MNPDPLVSNEPIRKAFEESRLTVSELADRVYPGAKATTRVGRALGIYEERGHRQTEIKTSTAKRLLDAMHLDPVDVGL